MDFSSVISFLNSIANSVLGFSSSVIGLMSMEVFGATLFEVLFSGAIGVFLSIAILKWVV